MVHTLIASIAYSTWNILPSGENVLTPLHLEHAHDNSSHPEITHTTSSVYTKHQSTIHKMDTGISYLSYSDLVKNMVSSCLGTGRAPTQNLCDGC